MDAFYKTKAWYIATQLAKEVYQIADTLPEWEKYCICDQMRRAIVSTLANFAEGYKRSKPKDKANKYAISRGECSEVTACLLICIEVGHIDKSNVNRALELADELCKILSGYMKSQQYYK